MRYRTFGWLFVMLSATAFVSAPTDGATKRLEVSGNDRFLITEDGKPFFWMGDTNWRLYKLSENEIDVYLNDRKAQKFNVIQGPVLLHPNDSNEWTNAYGESNTDPSDPNPAWFDHIDYIIDAANDRDMYVALVVTWGEMWDYFNSNSEARKFGKWLGQRYKNDKNVIWIVAGEYLIDGSSSQIINRWHYLGKGLAEGCDGKNLITTHGSYQEGLQSSSVALHEKTWLDFNMIQSSQSGHWGAGADNWNLITLDYNLSPIKPVLDGEAHYEGLAGWDAFDVRRRAYWSVFAGACGHTYGAIPVAISYRGGDDVPLGGNYDTWDEALDYTGAFDMKHLRRLMESRPMLRRKPYQSILLSDAGDLPNRIQATRDSAGRYAMIYVPEAGKAFTVNMNKISGETAKAWWFDPRTGSASAIGSYPTSGARTFTTPSTSSDWVLVLDDKSKNYPKPGEGGPLP